MSIVWFSTCSCQAISPLLYRALLNRSPPCVTIRPKQGENAKQQTCCLCSWSGSAGSSRAWGGQTKPGSSRGPEAGIAQTKPLWRSRHYNNRTMWQHRTRKQRQRKERTNERANKSKNQSRRMTCAEEITNNGKTWTRKHCFVYFLRILVQSR